MGKPNIGDRIRAWLWPLIYRGWGDTIDALVAERSMVTRIHHGDSEAYYRAYNAGFADGQASEPPTAEREGAE